MDLLSKNQTTAISSTIEKQLENQALIINTYMSSQIANQMLAFNKQQEAKRNMLSQYIDSEIEARMAAVRRDRDLRQKAFAVTSDADIDNKMAVIQQEATTKREALAQAYSEQTRLAKLLGNAQTMRDHINEGGDSAAASNTLALLLLKTQIFSGQGTSENDKQSNLPGNLQIQTSGTTATTAAGQLRDIEAVITAIQDRISNLSTEIQNRSNELLEGTGYNFLSEFSANTVPVTTTPLLSTTLAISIPLETAIAQRYEELFDLGGLTQAAEQTSDATPLFAEIKKLYPDLFDFDAMGLLSQAVTTDNPLYKAAMARTQELLELKNLQALPGDDTNTTITKSMTTIQDEINTLQSRLEAETATLENLTQSRDIAKESYTTLSKKQEEVNISSAITGSEVRLAIPAMTAVEHTESRLATIIMAGILGFLFGLVVSSALYFLMGNEPLRTVEGKSQPVWSRAVRWLLTPARFRLRWMQPSDDIIPPHGGSPTAS